MAQDPSGHPAETLEAYEALMATIPGLERKGKTMPYTSLNGHMFSFITKEGILALRLPTEAREAFLDQYDSELCVQYGKVMKEYVLVPDELLKGTAVLGEHFAVSYEYVGSLKPK
jgi:hypothetical protein